MGEGRRSERLTARTNIRRDREQVSNLRLSQFRRRVRELSDRLRELARLLREAEHLDPEAQQSLADLADELADTLGKSAVQSEKRDPEDNPELWLPQIYERLQRPVGVAQ